MVKGLSRRVIVVDSPDPHIFEQAIFIVRNDAAVGSGGVTSQQVVDQAIRIAKDYARSHGAPPRRRLRMSPWLAALLGGAVIGAVILVFDVTENARAEQSRREFTANVSHELKTPLQSIMGSAELIENGLVAEQDLPRFVGHIRTEAARLVSLIEDIIRLSQLDEGGELPFEVCDLSEIAQETTDSLLDTADKKQVTLEFEGEPLPLCSVKRLLAEICYNLCDNAIKYNREGGRVTVSTGRAGEEAVLTVKDTGIGIPPQHQDRVFERFYRVDKSHSKESGGTGLGLSIVKHAVQDLGGRITLDSTPGEGTEIRVFLPLKAN